MNPTKNEQAEQWHARVQRMAKWIAGHAVEVRTVSAQALMVGVTAGETQTSFLAPNDGTFPNELTVARCALAIHSAGVGERFQVGDFDDETLMRLIPPSVIGKWEADDPVFTDQPRKGFGGL